MISLRQMSNAIVFNDGIRCREQSFKLGDNYQKH